MPSLRIIALACVFFALGIGRSGAANVLIGVNTPGVEKLSEAQQDALIDELGRDGVKSVRTGLGEKFTRFIIRAYQKGIGCVVIVSPNEGGGTAHMRAADPSVGIHWAEPALTDSDPVQVKSWLSAQLAPLEAAGVHLAAIEVGNEINGPFYNGNFIPSMASGRQMGIADLNNPRDPEGVAIASSLRAYIKVVAAVKEARDESRVNHSTPIISAGLASAGVAGKRPGQKLDGVAVPDALQFMRQNGIDRLVDGYGVHAYTAPDPHRTVEALLMALNKDAFAMCTPSKLCWLTEWGFDNYSKDCPVDDHVREQLVTTMRGALQELAAERRLAASLYYYWGSGQPGDAGSSIFRCGSLTNAGKLAVAQLQ